MRIHQWFAAALAGAALCLALAASAEDKKEAVCPVSGQKVVVTKDANRVVVNHEEQYFCCANCPKAFAADPEKFIKKAGNCPVNKAGAAKVSKESRVVVNNGLFYACCANCPKAITAEPTKFLKLKDPVNGKAVNSSAHRLTHNGQIYVFESADSKAAFEKEPAKYVVQYK
jgi:YHS domain-containing protein